MDFEKEKKKVKKRLILSLKKRNPQYDWLYFLMAGLILTNTSAFLDVLIQAFNPTPTKITTIIVTIIALVSTIIGCISFSKMFFCLIGSEKRDFLPQKELRLREDEISYYLSLYDYFKKDSRFRNFVKETVQKFSNEKINSFHELNDKSLSLSLNLIMEENESKTRKKIQELELEREKINKKIIEKKEKIGMVEIEYNISND